MSRTENFQGIQALRAAAVILVVWLHIDQFLLFVTGRGFYTANVFGVDIFFVISGFIIATMSSRMTGPPEIGKTSNFLLRRLLRIFPLYWIFCFAFALVYLKHGTLFHENYTPSALLLPWTTYPNFALVIGYGWTLIFEIVFYVLVAVILTFTIRRAAAMASVLVAVLAAAGGGGDDLRHSKAGGHRGDEPDDARICLWMPYIFDLC